MITIISAVILTVIFSNGTAKASVIKLVCGILVSVFILMNNTSAEEISRYLTIIVRIADLFLPAYVLHLCFRNGKQNLGSAIFFTAGSNLIVTCLSLAQTTFVDKINMIDEIEKMYDSIYTTYVSIIAGSGINQNPEEISVIFNAVKELSVMLIPSVLILSCIILSYIHIVFSRDMLKMYLKQEHNQIEYFYQIRTGKLLSTMTIILLLLTYFSGSSYFASGVYNFAVIAGFIYVINGLAVVYFLLIKKTKKVSISIIILTLGIIVSIITSIIMPVANIFTVLFIVGLMDTTFNFRKLKKVGE